MNIFDHHSVSRGGTEQIRPTSKLANIYYGWMMVVIGSILMAATLPGRTHALGLITTRLLDDLQLSSVHYAWLNFLATIVGATFCIPCGWLMDRFGTRTISVVTLVSVGICVLAISRVETIWGLGIWLLLSRGFAQSMLSAISITVVAKWFGKRIGPAMGIYSVLMSLLMAAATGWLAHGVSTVGWREAWEYQGWTLLALALPVFWLSANEPRDRSVEFIATLEPNESNTNALGLQHRTLVHWHDALRTRCFWVFSLSISFFGLISSGLSLFNQHVLEERGFDESVYHKTLVLGLLVGMITNLVTGALTNFVRVERLLTTGLLLLGISLASFPFVTSLIHVYLYSILMGVAGGILTVLFFCVWGQAFGSQHLGKIQSTAQMITVFASALGPVCVSLSESHTGSYTQVFEFAAALALSLSVMSVFTHVPNVYLLHAGKVDASPSTERKPCPAN